MSVTRKCGKCGKPYTITNAEDTVTGNIHSVTVYCPNCGAEDGEVVLPADTLSAICIPG